MSTLGKPNIVGRESSPREPETHLLDSGWRMIVAADTGAGINFRSSPTKEESVGYIIKGRDGQASGGVDFPGRAVEAWTGAASGGSGM